MIIEVQERLRLLSRATKRTANLHETGVRPRLLTFLERHLSGFTHERLPCDRRGHYAALPGSPQLGQQQT
jgi:hypothetical protein